MLAEINFGSSTDVPGGGDAADRTREQPHLLSRYMVYKGVATGESVGEQPLAGDSGAKTAQLGLGGDDAAEESGRSLAQASLVSTLPLIFTKP